FRRDNIDMRHDINHVVRSLLLGERLPRPAARRQNQNSSHPKQQPSHGTLSRLQRHFSTSRQVGCSFVKPFVESSTPGEHPNIFPARMYIMLAGLGESRMIENCPLTKR